MKGLLKNPTVSPERETVDIQLHHHHHNTCRVCVRVCATVQFYVNVFVYLYMVTATRIRFLSTNMCYARYGFYRMYLFGYMSICVRVYAKMQF